jgi:glycosyltransferase involved in cell wall biosynthesis
MRIQFVTSNFPPEIGGIETHVYELCKCINKDHNVEVLWITSDDRKSKLSDFSVYKIPSKGTKAQTRTLFRVSKFRDHMNRFEPDLVHSHNIGHILPIYMANPNVKIVFTNHNSKYLKRFYTGSAYNYIRHKTYLQLADICIAPSEELKITTEGRTTVPVKKIPNGVDTTAFSPEGDEISVDEIDQDNFIVLTTRRFESKNGMKYLAQAIPETQSNISYVLVGDGTERKRIKHNISRQNQSNRVYMPGEIEHREISKYYRMADVTVMPSLKEAISISALESLATGTPIIGTNVGGIKELITHSKNGFLVPPKSPRAIANEINKIANYKEDDYKALCHNAREGIIENYDWSKIAKKTISAYEEVL